MLPTCQADIVDMSATDTNVCCLGGVADRHKSRHCQPRGGRATYHSPRSPCVAGNARERATDCGPYARPPGPVWATRRYGPNGSRSARPSGHYHAACPGEPTGDPTGRSPIRAAGPRDTTGRSPNRGAAPRGRRCGATSGPNWYRGKCSGITRWLRYCVRSRPTRTLYDQCGHLPQPPMAEERER